VTGRARTFIRGLNGAAFTASGGWDPTATTGPDVVLSGLRATTATSTFIVGLEGSTTGKMQYTGECYLTSYKTRAVHDDWTTWTAGFQVTAVVTRSSF
jgi:hypothetical protein